MPYVKNPRVDAYLDRLPDWQREILGRVRDLVHEADPEVEETIKRTVQPYFVLSARAAPRPDPVTLWHGALDKTAPVGMARWLSRRIAGSRLEILDGVGHMYAASVERRILEDVQAGMSGQRAEPT